jgi:HlyD family secretion protein
MTASAEIVTEVCDDCLSVPIQSVALRSLEQLGVDEEDGDQAARFEADSEGFVEVVWVVADGRATARQVETGIQSESHIEIVDGPDEGAQIVTGNYRAISRDLSDGSVVTVAGDDKG